ncbi:ACT domain [Dillenia turbinata]|uniref:ACT domain-containing protein ACR n=1 Tax=Dillenia turbinata TaxID=194707 RepID=A0AAN8UBW6_9MAGN
MKKVCWPYFDPDFENLPERIYGPSCKVSIDNESLQDCTLVKVDSVKKQGLLLQLVQVLTDLNLTITKSYISSDAGWFMDVFHVKDEHGHKLADQRLLNYIQQTIGERTETHSSVMAKASRGHSFISESSSEHTTIEMTATDRPGLFSEISAALADLHCNIVEAHAWSHNAHLACIANISDDSTDTPIEDPHRLAVIQEHLTTILRATTATTGTSLDQQDAKTADIHGGGEGTTTDMERRLHQLMLSVRDFDGPPSPSMIPPGLEGGDEGMKPVVLIESCKEKQYSVVSIQCKDRPRLMFDTVCTLTDMQYVIFHASTGSNGDSAFQEYYIRHVDGRTLHTESEKERVVKCLEAAIKRRVCQGVRLQLCAADRAGLLSDITRVLRENGLTVLRADVATQGKKAVNAFYIKDISGNDIDMGFVKSMRREMGPIDLEVKNETSRACSPEKSHFSISNMLKSQIERISHSFILTR